MSDDAACEAYLAIILGSPASGKTTLAARLSRELALPYLCKDDVKEALFEVQGCADPERSRLLSEASFAVIARLARTQLAAGRSCIIEGNWRAEHLPLLSPLMQASRARAAQIWCCADPRETVRRFTSRRRHPGHLDALRAPAELAAMAACAPAFLDLPGPRLVYRSDETMAYPELLEHLQSWRL